MRHQPLGVESNGVYKLIVCKMRELISRPILLSIFLLASPLCLLLHLGLILFVGLGWIIAYQSESMRIPGRSPSPIAQPFALKFSPQPRGPWWS
jgi:hypothetical protein